MQKTPLEHDAHVLPKAKPLITNPDQIDLDNKEALQQFLEGLSVQYIETASSTEVMKNLMIRRVCVLGEHQRGWGAFAKAPLAPGLYLDDYVGKPVLIDDLDDNTDTAYLYELSNDQYGIDAKEQGNWTRFINSTANAATANIHALPYKKTIRLFVKTPIQANEQLLLYYGDLFSYHTGPSNDQRYLKKSDRWEESQTIVETNKIYYDQGTASFLPPELAAYFKLDPLQRFFIPNATSLCDSSSVDCDIPVLACDEHAHCLPQWQQENITSLMVACWQGNQDQIHALLKKGANPTIQSSISGVSALHLIVAAPLPVAKKIALITLFVQFNALLHLQSKDDCTILHHAIKSHDMALVTFLFELAKQHPAIEEESLIDCINHKNQDIFLYAMLHGTSAMVRLFISAIKVSDLKMYLKNESLRTILITYLMTTDDLNFFTALTLIVNHDGRYNKATTATIMFRRTLSDLIPSTRRQQFAQKAPFPSDSNQLIEENQAYYDATPHDLDADFVRLFKMKNHYFYRLPTIAPSKRMNDATARAVDLPLIACFSNANYVPDLLQKKMTSLMLSCWQGDEVRVRTLLNQGANPNIQCNMLNYSALHVIVAAPLTTLLKKKLINLLLQYDASLSLQDCHERTLLHWVIERKELELAKWLVLENEQNKSIQDEESLLNCVDEYDYDPLYMLWFVVSILLLISYMIISTWLPLNFILKVPH